MQRRVLDKLVSGTGALLVVLLLAAGGLLTWGASFDKSDVHNQLAQQEIYFPPASAFKTATKNNTGEIQARMIPYLEKYAGQELLTGAQAEAYANHFIAYHLAAMPYGGVYSKVSAAALAAKPGSAQAAKLASLEGTVFQGTTLRGLLLEAYGFSTIGVIMMWAAVASFVGAIVMAILVGLGLMHARRTPTEEQIFAKAPIREDEPVAPVV